MPETIGRVVGETSSNSFQFAVAEAANPAVFEYIRIELEEEGERREVLAQIQSVSRRDPGMQGGTPIEAVEAMSDRGVSNTQTVARARVIGYASETGTTRPRHAPRPGDPVERAPNQFLEDFVTVGNAGLEVGNVLTRTSVPAEMDIGGLNRHLAILAATGAGKSHTAGVMIEEMLRSNATVVAIDPHGDYVQMREEADGEAFEHTDRVEVLKARSPGDDETQFTVKTSAIREDKLASLAGINDSSSNQRRLIKNAVEEIEENSGEAYTVEDIVDKMNEFEDREDISSEDQENAIKVGYKLERLANYDVFGASSHRLDRLVSPRQLTVIDLSGIPFDAQDIITRLVLDRLYQARIAESLGESGETYEYPIFTVVEEAHRFCPGDDSTSAGEKLGEIAREGRKFGMFLSLITQRPSRIDQDVLSQCNSMIAQRIINGRDQDAVTKASESMAEDLAEELPGLNVGEAIVTGPAVDVPLTVKIRERHTRHGGDDIDIHGNLRDAGEAVEEAEELSSDLGERDELGV